MVAVIVTTAAVVVVLRWGFFPPGERSRGLPVFRQVPTWAGLEVTEIPDATLCVF